MGDIRLSCYSAPWGMDGIIPAISDIADCGFEGLEAPASVVNMFEDRLHVFEEILESGQIKLCGLLQAVNLFDKEKADEQVERAANSARFVGAAGKGALTVCQSDLLFNEPSDDDWLTASAILEEIGERCAEFGVRLCFMPRAGYFGASEKVIKRLLAMTRVNNVWLSVDTAELTLAGVDPVKIIKSHSDRLHRVRFRDVSGSKRRAETTTSRPGTAPAFGRGAVKFDLVTKAILDMSYDGWLTLDVTGESQAAKDAALGAYRFIMRRSGLYPI